MGEHSVSRDGSARHDGSVVLIGFMATGKTVVGMALADALGCRFIDTDRVIEDAQHMTIADIFHRDGEEAFRACEKRAVQSLHAIVQHERCVIATGGGTVIDPDNLRLLKAFGPMVCLQADPDTIMARSAHGNGATRPLLAVPKEDARSAIVELLASRQPYYANADVHIETSRRDPSDVVALILEQLGRAGVERGTRSSPVTREGR